MATLEDNTELYDILNSAINEMKADGTMDFLADAYLTMQPSVETEPVEMPVIEGAKTYKVAVTGELSPLDHLSADGVPTGFNVAVLSEISKRANINIELEVMGPDARFSALNSGRIDAFFWTTAIRCEEHPEIGAIEFYGGI